MDEKIKNIIVPISIVIIVVLLAYIVSIVGNKSKNLVTLIDFAKYDELKNGIVLVSDSNNKDGNRELDTLKSLAKTYYLDIYYLDKKDKDDEYNKFIKDKSIENKNDIMLFIVKDSKIVARLDNKSDIEKILNFLSENDIKIISRDLIGISVSEYLELIKNDLPKLVYVARPTCEYCQMMSPVLKGVMEEYKFNTYYLNTDEMSEDDYENFVKTNDSLKEGFGTPMLIYTKDGSFIDTLEGYNERSALVDFLKTNKIITVEK